MSEQPITGYTRSQFRVVPVETDIALVTYFADIHTPGNDVVHHMAVGEFWFKRNGQWFIRGNSYEGRPNRTQKNIRVVAQDSQGRRLYRWISNDGSSHSQVYDPVAAEEIVWNTSCTKAKVLKRPAPVADRRSCWRGRDSEGHIRRDEPRFGVSEFSCSPRGHQSGRRDACEAERLANALPPEKEGFPKCDSAEPGGTAGDLGIDVVQGVEAHGCRTTTPFS
ncbi:MAG TPA: hypothetical protein VIX37_07570 [Candidatus Sulfotelmatobacter sp.]